MRDLRQDLVAQLASITDNSVTSQVVAAVTLVKMKVAPVISLNIPFGYDNHADPALGLEVAQTIAGVAAIEFLMEQLAADGLKDQVTFMSLSVFGRTFGPGTENGRQHNPNHQVSLAGGEVMQAALVQVR